MTEFLIPQPLSIPLMNLEHRFDHLLSDTQLFGLFKNYLTKTNAHYLYFYKKYHQFRKILQLDEQLNRHLKEIRSYFEEENQPRIILSQSYYLNSLLKSVDLERISNQDFTNFVIIPMDHILEEIIFILSRKYWHFCWKMKSTHPGVKNFDKELKLAMNGKSNYSFWGNLKENGRWNCALFCGKMTSFLKRRIKGKSSLRDIEDFIVLYKECSESDLIMDRGLLDRCNLMIAKRILSLSMFDLYYKELRKHLIMMYVDEI